MRTHKRIKNELKKYFKTRELIKKAKSCDYISYYPEEKLKSRKEVVSDNIKWIKKYQDFNEFYTLYGFDRREIDQTVFLDNRDFLIARNKINNSGADFSKICLLRDKFLFFKYLDSFGFKSIPKVFSIIIDGIVFNHSMKKISLSELSCYQDFFIKQIDGECASFVKYVSTINELKDLLENDCKKGTFILQEKVIQNEKMSVINPYALNTYRVVTVLKNNEPVVFSSVLRIGTKQSGNVDNWAAGGLAIGIDNNGKLKKYGFYKPGHGTKVDTHPDTKLVFEGYDAPMCFEAEKLACDAHKYFYDIRAIGWDVAISETGPIIIEGNDNFEISLLQAADKPLKQEWELLIK